MLYNYTARALLRADPLLSVGGPATAELAHVPDFLAFTQNGSAAVPAAFVSSEGGRRGGLQSTMGEGLWWHPRPSTAATRAAQWR